MRRVVITGMGTVNPLGKNVEEFGLISRLTRTACLMLTSLIPKIFL